MSRGPSIRRNLPIRQSDRVAKQAKNHHWGVAAKQVIRWNDPDYPTHGIPEMGRLVEFNLIPIDGGRPLVLPIPEAYVEQSHLCFDMKHPHQRLYVFTPPAVCAMARGGWNAARSQRLVDVARSVGGRHASGGYPNVQVTPLGLLHDVVYRTAKGSFEAEDEPDGLSTYTHEHGEVTGLLPALCVDARGRFWYAGGNYAVPRGGIDD